MYSFRLYVAGDSRNSVDALANLTTICKEWLPQQHEIEIVDVFREPERALADGILMTPMVVKLGPTPVRIVGALNETVSVIRAFGLGRVTA
jgi:circadian clock protein KaiB